MPDTLPPPDRSTANAKQADPQVSDQDETFTKPARFTTTVHDKQGNPVAGCDGDVFQLLREVCEALDRYEADHSGNDNPDPCGCPLCVSAREALDKAKEHGIEIEEARDD